MCWTRRSLSAEENLLGWQRPSSSKCPGFLLSCCVFCSYNWLSFICWCNNEPLQHHYWNMLLHCTEVPSATICQMISTDHGIASQWPKLARLLGLSRSQIDLVRLECHNRPQPCQQSAAQVLSLWSNSGGTAHSCSLATLLRVLKHMDERLVLFEVVQYLQVGSTSWGESHCFWSAIGLASYSLLSVALLFSTLG